jgi:hypothetical protein
MDRGFGFGNISFSRAGGQRSSDRDRLPMRNLREGDIIPLGDSDDDLSPNESQKFRDARIKRIKGRDSFRSDLTQTLHRESFIPLNEFRVPIRDSGNPNSLRSQQFADLSFDDDEDIDLPSPANGEHVKSQYIDRDPYESSTLPNHSKVDRDDTADLVDLDAAEFPRRCIYGYTPSLPIPPLTEAMATFKLKIASKKEEMNAAHELQVQTTERVRSLQEELLAVKSQLDSTRQRFEQLDDNTQNS